MTRPGQPPGPDAFDADLSAARDGVEYASVARAIWEARREPDPFARRCAYEGIEAIDTGIAALYRIRAEWVTEIRQADDQAAARADQLLARMREGPDATEARPPDRTSTTHADPPPAQGAKSCQA